MKNKLFVFACEIETFVTVGSFVNIQKSIVLSTLIVSVPNKRKQSLPVADEYRIPYFLYRKF